MLAIDIISIAAGGWGVARRLLAEGGAILIRQAFTSAGLDAAEKALLRTTLKSVVKTNTINTLELLFGTLSVFNMVVTGNCTAYDDCNSTPPQPPGNNATSAEIENYKKYQRCQAIQKWLFALEILSLSGDIIVRKFFRKATREANEILPSTNPYSNISNVDYQKMKSVLNSLDNIAQDYIAFLDNLPSSVKNKLNSLNLSDEKKFDFMFDFQDRADDLLTLGQNNIAIERWSDLYDLKAVDRSVLEVITNPDRVISMKRYYQNNDLLNILEGVTYEKRWMFLDKMGDVSPTNFSKFVNDSTLITSWIKYYDDAVLKSYFTALGETKMIRFLEDYGDASSLVFNKFKQKPKLMIYWEKVYDNPLHSAVHSFHIKSVNFLEDVQHAYTVKKTYPPVHEYHPGLKETISDHIKGSPVKVTHNGNEYIVGYTGFHADYAITEPNHITLVEATLPGGKKYYPNPLPTVNAPIQTAIRSGTQVSGTGAKDCQVWMWGFVTKTENGVLSLRLDINGNPIRSWVKKSNSAQTTIFTGMNKDKTLIEVAYARHNLTLQDWVKPKKLGRTSNEWIGWSSEGVEMRICIGPEVATRPAMVPDRTLPYGTIYPIK